MKTTLLIASILALFALMCWAGKIRDRSSDDEWKRIGRFVEVVFNVAMLGWTGLTVVALSRL
jgi:hypothetical protein